MANESTALEPLDNALVLSVYTVRPQPLWCNWSSKLPNSLK